MSDVTELARRLDDAARSAQATAQISLADPGITLDAAYRVQAALLARRCSRGERIIGVKMGFTSRAKMAQMGVSDLIWGRLTDAMAIEDGGGADLARFVHPRVEPEIAFRLKSPLSGPVTLAEAQAAIEATAAAIEVIDSRYADFRFSLEDVVADNSSSSAFCVGPWRRLPDDLSNLGMVMSINGAPAQFGSSSAILGDPLRSVVAAARLAAASGVTLEAGWIILAGAATSADAVGAGQVRLEAEGLGRVSFTLVDGART